MVGLSDIPFVGNALDRISDATVDGLLRGLRYMFCYKDLANVLNSEIEKVDIQLDRVSRKAVAERADGKRIEDHVLKWQKEVEDIKESAKEFSERYKNRPSWRCIWCLPIPKPMSRFYLGREAAQKGKRVTKLTNSGKEILANDIAHLPPIENFPKIDTAFQIFQSRKEAYENLWEALVTEGSSLILGIYGMPGVGKTRMMEQIWKEAKEKGIFDKVTRANVGSEKLDVIKLQNQIAGYLNCHFESQDNVDHRASQLKNSLMNGGKILIILDDVWSVIPLEIIGISFGDGSSSEGCKILLTSREKDVCLRNNCKHPVKITTLRVDEAWDLFRYTVGTCQIDSVQDESLVKEVCKKCAGLPLLIHAVGKALQFMRHNSWKDALYQLENCKIENISGIRPEVYACLKLSFDNLVEDAKLCLLLCSLFPEDAEISTIVLFWLATGLQLVHGGRSRVLAMVDILNSSSLLLEGEDDEHFKLHDIIRDVARSIAVRDPRYAFLLVRCGSRLPDNADYNSRKLLHLDLQKNNVHFPVDLVCPDLINLWLQCNRYIQKFSGGFFSMFLNLRFLVLQRLLFSSLNQFSLQPLSKLSTLILDYCDISNINETEVNFFPGKLETLCIRGCFLPRLLDLPNLKYLRKLEIQPGVIPEVLMAPNTIASLSSLEELHIPIGLSIWDDSIDTSVSILDEISKLSCLTSLQMHFKDFEPSKYTDIFCNLHEFNIRVGFPWVDFYHQDSRVSLLRLIELNGYGLEGLEGIMERSEEVRLCNTDVKVSSICSHNREAFSDLRNLYIEDCGTMEHLVLISQDEIYCSIQPWTSFSKLVILEIRNCSAIRYLFCNSVAICLVQLQQLCIEKCPLMEAIIMSEGTINGDIISFSRLKSLKLLEVPRLTSFYREKKEMQFSSTSITNSSGIPSDQFQPLFDGTVAFPSMEELHISYLEDTSDIWGKNYYNDNVSFGQIKSLLVANCNKLEIVVPLAMSHKLQNLEVLSVHSCTSVISEVGNHGNNIKVCPLVALRDMNLIKLPCLTKTGLNSRDQFGAMTLYPNLKNLDISECDSLRNVFLPSIATDLLHLKKMCVVGCKMMREIIGAGEQDITDSIVFPDLTLLHLNLLPNLTGFWCYQSEKANICKVDFPNLVDFEFSCGKINLEEIDLGRENSTCKLKTLKISCDDEIQLPCKWQLRSTDLERLTFRHCWWQQQKFLCFQTLKVLKVHESRCRTLFSLSAFGGLQHLQELEVSNCDLLEEIVENVPGIELSGMDNKTITLFHLKSVILTDLPSLKSFVQCANYEFDMPALKKVEVSNCGLSALFTRSIFRNLQQLQNLQVSNCKFLEGIVEDVKGAETSGSNDKMFTLFRLSAVILKNLPNLRSFIEGANYECHMPALKKVEVDNCGFSTLFTCSLMRTLQQLRELQVSNCRLLESIVEDVRGNETFDKTNKIITLLRLLSVVLRNLPNLKYFIHSSNNEFQMPALNDVLFVNCGLSTLFTCSVFRNLQQLRSLEVWNCRLLEGIIEDVMVNESSVTNGKVIKLFQLSSVVLRDLPNLVRFINGANYECHMPNLEQVEVDNCGLCALFTCSVFRNLPRLKYLQVMNCRFLEGIVDDVMAETSDTIQEIITHFRLSSVVLKNLPNLKSFGRTATYAFMMPRLDTFYLLGCPQVENFSYLKTSTGLVSVYTEWHNGKKIPDLNDYIRQNRERGSNLTDSAEESSDSDQELKTESESAEDEHPQYSDQELEVESETESESVEED